ncbi:MAG: hypothetical protein LLG43_01070 [Deltaproteobacteria bacterium]|nr:hypothetical protein [Deltaproteobacteria bacterium]
MTEGRQEIKIPDGTHQQIINPKLKYCRYCSASIKHSSKVCRECGRDQRWYLNYFRVDHIGMIITLGMMLIAYQQLKEVRSERVSAGQALVRAQGAEVTANKVTKNVGIIETKVKEQERTVNAIAESAKDAFSLIESTKQLSLQAKSELKEAQQLSIKTVSEVKSAHDLTNQAKSDVRNTKDLVKKAERSVDQMKETVEFNDILAKAKNDDRLAFNQLVSLSNGKGRFRKESLEAIGQIALDDNVRIDIPVKWSKYSLDPKTTSFVELIKIYPSLHSIYKPDFISTIWTQDRFPKLVKLDFLYTLIKAEKSLRALDRACRLMNQEAKVNKNIIGANEYMIWWEIHRTDYIEVK